MSNENITQKLPIEDNSPTRNLNSTEGNNIADEYANIPPKKSHNLNVSSQSNNIPSLPNKQTKRSLPSSSCPSSLSTSEQPDLQQNKQIPEQSNNLLGKLIGPKITKGKLHEKKK